MKTQLVSIPAEELIDWDTPQLVQYENGMVILTTGEHTEWGRFSGTIVHIPDNEILVGRYRENWSKGNFKPYKGRVMIDSE